MYKYFTGYEIIQFTVQRLLQDKILARKKKKL